MALVSKMKYALILVTAISIVASIWFVLGSTSAFNRSWDLIETVIFFAIVIPTAFLFILALAWIVMGFKIENKTHIIAYVLLVIFLLLFSKILFQNTTPYGWLKENVHTSIARTTADGIYEYRLEIVNPFQRNTRARVHLVNLETNENSRIMLEDVRGSDEIQLISFSHTIELFPTKSQEVYLATITLRSNDKPVQYLLNFNAGTAIRIYTCNKNSEL